MNSILYDVRRGLIIDKSGVAIKDIDAKVLRIPAFCDPERKLWADPRKLARFFKFYARDWKPSDQDIKFVWSELSTVFTSNSMDKAFRRQWRQAIQITWSQIDRLKLEQMIRHAMSLIGIGSTAANQQWESVVSELEFKKPPRKKRSNKKQNSSSGAAAASDKQK